MTNRILVADDQADILESLRLLLKNEDFDIESVSSPNAVLDAIKSSNYDVLLLDMNYARDTTSGGEGLELLSSIRQLDDALPVVLMTAWGNVELAVKALQGGGGDFVQKPWDNRKLVDTLRRQIGEGQVRREKNKREKVSEQFLRDMGEAHDIQQRLLPVEMPQVPGCEIQASWQPAGNIGGDYFDAIQLEENTVAFCIADVCGKGLPAALLMSNIQAMVRAYAEANRSPAAMCRQLNRTISENTLTGRFVTLFYGVLDIANHSLRYTNAGHVPPILVRGSGATMRLTEGGTVLGCFPESDYEESETAFNPGDHLSMLTDGITEAANADGDQFGEGERIVNVLLANRGKSAGELKQALLNAVASFTDGELQDDATLMVVSML